MRIEELIPEQSITFLVLIGNQQLEFSTKVLESIPNKRMILAAPIIKDNKIRLNHKFCGMMDSGYKSFC